MWGWAAIVWLTAGFSAFPQEQSESQKALGMNAFGKMVPLGFVNRMVRIPTFEDGRLSSIVTADTLVRIDDQRLETGKTVVELVGEAAAETVRVDLQSAIYHLEDRVLRSGDRSRISRSDFVIEGDSLVFDAETSIGRVQGNVRTTITDTEALSGVPTEGAKPGNQP